MEPQDERAAAPSLRDTPPERSGEQGLTTADLAHGQPAPDPTAVAGREPDNQTPSLFPPEDAKSFQARWDPIQVSFVDEPRRAVEQADALVAEALKRQAEIFSAARSDLEAQWDRGQDVSTEDLRQALQRYRAFFTRVLKV